MNFWEDLAISSYSMANSKILILVDVHKRRTNGFPTRSCHLHSVFFFFFAENPRPLLHICRLQIRESLGTNLVGYESVYDLLPLPQALKDYLTYSEV